MKPSEIREELLSQHASLRGRLEAARLAVNGWAAGDVPRNVVRNDSASLADALRSHNMREERALGELILAVDAWGPQRLEIMNEAHVREHHDLFEALLAVSLAQDPREGARELERLHARLLDHMAREEETFLNASVLRDDAPANDAQEG